MNYLQRHYPFTKHKIGSILWISLAVSLLLYILQPFGFDAYSGSKIGASLAFGGITFIGLFLFNFLLKKRWAKTLKKWTIQSEILYILGLILTITLLNYLYFSMVIMDSSFRWVVVGYVLYYTFFIGLIPSVTLVLIKYNRFLRAEIHSLTVQKGDDNDFDIVITNQLTRENDLHIKFSDFSFAEADKNNVNVYHLQGEELKSSSIRSTISAVEEELRHPSLFRCHRSFIINLNQVESAKGNSNGYQLKLKHVKQEIPVSRKYVADFKLARSS